VLITLTYIHPKHRPLLVCHCCQHCFPPHETPLVVFGIYFIKWFSLRFKVEMYLDFKRLWCKQQRSPFGSQFVPRLCFAYGSRRAELTLTVRKLQRVYNSLSALGEVCVLRWTVPKMSLLYTFCSFYTRICSIY